MASNKNRKSLMATLAEYQREEKQKRDYSAKKKPNLSKKAASAKSNTKKAFGYNDRLDESLGARNGKKTQSMKDRRDESKGAEKAAGRPAYSGNKSSNQGSKPKPKPTTSAQSNKDGTYGRSMPSNPKVGITMKPRKKRPGTGRTGEAAAKAANRKPTRGAKPMTAAEKMAMRRRARRGR